PSPTEALLVRFNLVKKPDELIAAYHGAGGVTADFSRNRRVVINRELGADFDPRAFDHVAIYDDELNRIEMHLRARHAQTISIPGAEMEVGFAADETVRTEISCKFTKDGVERQLTEAAMELRAWHVDALS